MLMNKTSKITAIALTLIVCFSFSQQVYADCAIGHCGETTPQLWTEFLDMPENTAVGVVIICMIVLSLVALVWIRKRNSR